MRASGGHASAFDLDGAYALYPRKEGKTRGMKIAARDVRTPEDYEALRRAIGNYARIQELRGTEAKYIKHFATFMGEWRDWVDVAPPVSSSARPNSSNGAAANPRRGIAPVRHITDEEAGQQ